MLRDDEALAKLAGDVTKLHSRTADLEVRANALQAVEIRVDVDFATPSRIISGRETSAGIQSAVALFDSHKTRYRFVTDYQFSHQQVTPNSYRLSFVYKPELPEQILGKQIDFLAGMNKLAVEYATFVQEIGLVVDRSAETKMNFAFWVNGVEVIRNESLVAKPGVLIGGQALLDVGPQFAELPTRYKEAVRAKALRP